MTDDIVRDDMSDWWDEYQQRDAMRQQFDDETAMYNEHGRMLNRMEEHYRRHGMKVEPQDTLDVISGTYLQGYVEATYYDLVRAFGQPMHGDGYKTRAEWALVFTVPSDGDEPDEDIVATVYDWKKSDQEVFSVTKWNVGGHSASAVDLVKDYLNYVRDMEANAQQSVA
jgi:membrane-bound lytic murein transglycosylase B